MAMDDKTTPVGMPRFTDVAQDELPPGTLVGDYVLAGLLAHGGHGSVYAASHRALGHRAAVKVLRIEFADSSEMQARFAREVRVVNRIHHPEIVEIYDLGALPDGRPYCAMEFLDGRSLDAVIRERAPLAPAEAVALLAPVCRALQAAHEFGVVHRDVKASNIMVLGPTGAGPARVKLLDFGIAKAVEADQIGLTTVGQRLGTAGAMAPEQIVGERVDARADIYALGVLLFRLLTGRAPFTAPDADEVERMHLEVPPPRPSEVAPLAAPLDAVVARCLEKRAQRRWPTAAALLDAAQAALDIAVAAPTRRQPAVAVQVFLRLPADADEELLVAQAEAAEVGEAAFREAGFQLPVATPGVLLAVKLLPASAFGDRSVRAEAVELARRLEELLARPGLRLSLAVNIAEADVRDGPDGAELGGGPACLPPELPEGDPVGLGIGPDVLPSGEPQS
jgi:tRNA A-37 threonylcarbamoyl transferase component Bud32